MELSAPQKRVVRHASSDRTSLFVGGAIRSGKSWASTLGMVVHLAQAQHEHDAAICGQSVETAMRNVGFTALDMAAGLGLSASLDKRFGTRLIVNGRNIWVLGASDAKARRRIQGATLCALLADEAVLLPRDFYMQAWGRLSVAGAKMWATYNPEGPAHWFLREVLKRADDYDGEVVDFRLSDNPSLVDSVKERYERSFTGHWHQRLIEGKWAGASGLIFPRWTECDAMPFERGGWRASMDWGVSGVIHCLIASTAGPLMKIIGELRHDARTDGVWTETEAVDAIASFVLHHAPKRTALYVDPSTPESVKRLLRLQGLRVLNANNDVAAGLSRTAAALADETVRVSPVMCPALVEEMHSYQWDDAKTELGQDAPTKVNDHGCDSCRYLVHSVGWTAGQVKATTVKEAMA